METVKKEIRQQHHKKFCTNTRQRLVSTFYQLLIALFRLKVECYMVCNSFPYAQLQSTSSSAVLSVFTSTDFKMS